MATQPNIASLLERYFQDYADAAEIKKILVDASESITQQNQLVTLKYLADNYLLKGAVVTPDMTGVELQVHKGVANGYPALGADGKVPGDQLPIQDDLTSHDPHTPLSANQGRVLNEELATKLTTAGLVAYEQLAHKGAAHGYAGLDANKHVESVLLNIVDALTSHDVHALLSANQGRILHEELQTKVSALHLENYELLAHKAAASGYTPLDQHKKVPVIHLPPSIANPHHVFTTQALMLAGGAGIDAGQMVLVHGDPVSANNGEYVALQNHPTTLNHFDHLGFHVRKHRHSGPEIDVVLNGTNQHLDKAITVLDHATDAVKTEADKNKHDLAVHLANSKTAHSMHAITGLDAELAKLHTNTTNIGKNTTSIVAVKATADKAKADIATHTAKTANAHTIASISGLAARVAAIATNTRHIHTNTTGVAAAKASAAKAESDLHKHIIDKINAHDYKAIGNIDKVFTNKLAGFNDTGVLSLVVNIDAIHINSVYSTNHLSTGVFPHGINQKNGIIVTYGITVSGAGEQILYGRGDINTGKMWTRELKNKSTRTAWKGHNVSSGTAAPTGGDDGDTYVQHS